MHISERDDFVKLLIGIAGMYRADLSEVVLKIYWKTLQRYSWQDVSNALFLHAQDPDTGQFMPKPADVIRIIKGNTQSQCLQAWSKVTRAIRTVGPYFSVVFDDSTIHAVIDEMGGWVKLCRVNEKEISFMAREFQTRYIAYKYQPPDSYPAKLIGLTEHYNLIQGYQCSEMMLIGDEAQAKSVLEKSIEQNQIKTQKIKRMTHQTMEDTHA